MKHNKVKRQIEKVFTVAGVLPLIKHPSRGPDAGTYLYLPWDAERATWARNWVWLGPWKQMCATLCLVNEYPDGSRDFRAELPGRVIQPRYFLTQAQAIHYFMTQRWDQLGGTITDRRSGKIIFPLPKTGSELI